MRFLCARLYNSIEQKHPALHFYLGTSVTSCPGSGRRASISLHAAHVLWSLLLLRDCWVWLHLLHQAAVTTALSFPGVHFQPGAEAGAGHTQGWALLPSCPPAAALPPDQPHQRTNSLCRGRGIREAQNTAQG